MRRITLQWEVPLPGERLRANQFRIGEDGCTAIEIEGPVAIVTLRSGTLRISGGWSLDSPPVAAQQPQQPRR
jgi:hypothetical protein